MSLRKLLAAATAIAGGVVTAGLLAPGPAGAAALPDLKVTVAVTPDQPTYTVGDPVTTTFTITNVGDAPAVNVRDLGGRDQGVHRTKHILQDPFDLAPGASREIGWDGEVDQAAAVAGYATGTWAFTNDSGEANDADNSATYRIAVPSNSGELRVKVFVDVRGDYDSNQPGLAGATVVVRGESGAPTFTGTTDQWGLIYFSGIPVGQAYIASVTGWTLRGDENAGRVQVLAGRNVADLALVPGSGPGPSPSGSPSGSPSATASGSAGGGTASPSPAPAPGLAFTGSNTAPLLGAGTAIAAAGAVVIVAAYRRRRRFVLPD